MLRTGQIIQLKGKPNQYKTYQIASPVSTHTRPASCSEVGCRQHAEGWIMKISTLDPLGQQQADYIKVHSGRHFKTDCTCLDCDMHKQEGYVIFHFSADQNCFTGHRVSLERPELYFVRDGDRRMRANARRHSSPDSWLNDFGEHQDKLKRTLEG